MNLPLLRIQSTKIILLAFALSLAACGAVTGPGGALSNGLASGTSGSADGGLDESDIATDSSGFSAPVSMPMDIPVPIAKGDPIDLPNPGIPHGGSLPPLDPEKIIVTLYQDGLTLKGLPDSLRMSRLAGFSLFLCEVQPSEMVCPTENPHYVHYAVNEEEESFDEVSFVLQNPENEIMVAMSDGNRRTRGFYLKKIAEGRFQFAIKLESAPDGVPVETAKCKGDSGAVCSFYPNFSNLPDINPNRNLPENIRPLPDLNPNHSLPDNVEIPVRIIRPLGNGSDESVDAQEEGDDLEEERPTFEELQRAAPLMKHNRDLYNRVIIDAIRAAVGSQEMDEEELIEGPLPQIKRKIPRP